MIPCMFYLYIHSVIFRTKGKIVKIKEIEKYLHEWRIPKKYRYFIIKEMEKLELLKLNNREAELEYPKLTEDNFNDYCFDFGIIKEDCM